MPIKPVLRSPLMAPLLAVFAFVSATQASTPKEKCIQFVEAKYENASGKKQKEAFLKELKECHQKPESRYERYYKVCKAFRLSQVRQIGKKRVLNKLKQCRLDAEIYEKSINRSHLENCDIKPCVLTDKIEMCMKEYQKMGNVGVADCRKLYAPLGCMLIPEEFNHRQPTTVFWGSGSVKGEVKCSEI